MAAAREGEYPRAGALIGLLLGIWPYLVLHPSIPMSAPTLQAVYPTLGWEALALPVGPLKARLGRGPLREEHGIFGK